MIIYKITNLINNKIYIGQDSNNNSSYYGSGKAIISAIKKYGKENFIKETLTSCKDFEDMNEKEVYWISLLNSTDRKIGYNISIGGKEGDRQTGYDITKKGVYNYWKDKYGKEEADIRLKNQKEKLSNHFKQNGVFSNGGVYQHWVDKYGVEEAEKRKAKKIEKLKEANKKRKEEGWHHSEESLNKIRNTSKNRITSEETKLKMSKSRIGIKYSEITINKMKSKRDIGNKPIIQLSISGDFIKEWKSQTEIKQVLNLKIWNVLNGIQKTSGGYKWEYKK